MARESRRRIVEVAVGEERVDVHSANSPLVLDDLQRDGDGARHCVAASNDGANLCGTKVF
jgi:hypothetical protein